jgi:uncharacterized membrane protein
MSYHSAATFRTLGAAATAQNLFTIYNGHASKVVRVRRCVFQMDATAALTAVMPIIKTCRVSAASAGTALTIVDWDSAAASDALVVARGANASDGGTATAITATPGTTLWQQFGMRLHTAVGQVLAPDNNSLSMICETNPVILRPGEGLLVHIVAAATSSNPNTNHYFVQAAWTEDAS